jgi:hypothetical protein
MRVESEQRPSAGTATKRAVTSRATSAPAAGPHALDRLDWQAFSAGCFPGRHRHDLEALSAYGAYRRSHAVDAPPPDGHAPIAAAAPAGSTALQDWEDEGGAAF